MADFGRPPKYDAVLATQGVKDYIEKCQQKNFLPTVEGLAVELNLARSTIYEWRQTHSEFSDVVERMLAGQASQLIQNSLVGQYNASITKLLLSKHKGHDDKPYIEKQDITSDGRPLLISSDE
jgi:DNA-packaging protein gp3